MRARKRKGKNRKIGAAKFRSGGRAYAPPLSSPASTSTCPLAPPRFPPPFVFCFELGSTLVVHDEIGAGERGAGLPCPKRAPPKRVATTLMPPTSAGSCCCVRARCKATLKNNCMNARGGVRDRDTKNSRGKFVFLFWVTSHSLCGSRAPPSLGRGTPSHSAPCSYHVTARPVLGA